MSVCMNRWSTGASLIEVLIAVLIFTSGALGLAGMQLVAKRNTYEATQRSIATGLAGDILEQDPQLEKSQNRQLIEMMSNASEEQESGQLS